MPGSSPSPLFAETISRVVWEQRYRLSARDGTVEPDLYATLARVARALAAPEGPEAARWERRFLEVMQGWRFLPAGRVLAGAGSGHRMTLFNCFVMGLVEDSTDGIFRALQEAAVTMQQGGGVGCDFSTLRPAGTTAKSSGRQASGPVSFMALWDQCCRTLTATWPRRGAMMATLRCDHPDIERFIDAKIDADALNCFNLSVQVTDAFMQAVTADEDWPLVFPDPDGGGDMMLRRWPGYGGLVPCRVRRTVPARRLWHRLAERAAGNGEPGVLFIDRINDSNNLGYRELISATNPCGEVPLPPYGVCDLGSINLAAFVSRPFTPGARLDLEAIEAVVPTAVRMLDNVIDVSGYPLPAQAEQSLGCRRIGLGVMGLADALLMLGLAYDGGPARRRAAEAMRTICHAAYRASTELAREKGGFPFLDREQYLRSSFIKGLPAEIRRDIGVHGIRNSHLTAIAPTGSISLLANNVSSGIEPIFSCRLRRHLRDGAGRATEFVVTDDACRRWQRISGDESLPPAYRPAQSLPARAHLAMQSALQPFVDQSIAKTVNLPPEAPSSEVETLFIEGWEAGLKGLTVFRQGGREAVLTADEAAAGCNREVCNE